MNVKIIELSSMIHEYYFQIDYDWRKLEYLMETFHSSHSLTYSFFWFFISILLPPPTAATKLPQSDFSVYYILGRQSRVSAAVFAEHRVKKMSSADEWCLPYKFY